MGKIKEILRKNKKSKSLYTIHPSVFNNIKLTSQGIILLIKILNDDSNYFTPETTKRELHWDDFMLNNAIKDLIKNGYLRERKNKYIVSEFGDLTNNPNDAYTYLIGDGIHYKIGLSITPEKRFKQIKSHNINAHLLCYGKGITESELHRIYDDYRVEGEWFSLSASQVDTIYTLIDNEKVGITFLEAKPRY